MNCLIDTHIFLCLLFDPNKISRHQLDILEQPDHSLYLSNLSLWELSLKYSIGRLRLEGIKSEELSSIAEKMGINFLSLNTKTAASFHKFPKLRHKEPFDRMIIWQAIKGDY